MLKNIFAKGGKKSEKKEKIAIVSAEVKADNNFGKNDILVLRPVITEKSSSFGEQGKYVFEVLKKANKPDVKKAIEKIYSVKVDSVRMINLHGKTRMIGRFKGKKSGIRKAIVTLSKGQKIDLAV